MEMVGGCCICSDERGWTENPLVYCDGQGCTVAVHQACYGIVTVPSGNWYCRKCESQERAAKVKCELCPCKEGAFKKTDTGGWAHVVCALYIPEVRFGNVTSMEPIIQTLIPTDRFNKSCYICEGQGKEAKAKIGACMNCNKSGCKNHFHVTCAQAEGLLCEEAGTYLDNVKYCGYCQHHYSKLKKGSNLKAVPAFKPSTELSDSKTDKSNSGAAGSGWSSENPATSNGSKDKKKKNGRKSQVSPKSGNHRESTSSSVIVETPSTSDDSKGKPTKSESTPFANVLAGVGLVPGPKAPTSDLVDSDKNESSEFIKQEPVRNSETTKQSGSKKNDKHTDSSRHQSTSSAAMPSSFAPVLDIPPTKKSSAKSRTVRRKSSARSTTPTSSTGGHDTESTLSNISDPGFMAAPDGVGSDLSSKSSTSFRFESAAESSAANPMSHSVIVTSASVLHSETTTHSSVAVINTPNQRTVSPLVISSAFSNSSSSAAAGNSSQSHLDEARLNYSSMDLTLSKNSKVSAAPAKPAKKPRRGRTPKAVIAPESPPSSPDSAVVSLPEQSNKRKKKVQKNNPTVGNSAIPLHGEGVSSEPSHSMAGKNQDNYLAQHMNLQSSSLTTDNPMKRIHVVNNQMTDRFLATLASQEVPVANSSALTENLQHHGNFTSVKEVNDSKESPSATKQQRKRPYSRNGISAPHMLGNQINPASSVAQKMSETLTAELEAHNVVTHSSPIGNLTGVPFPSRSISPTKMSTVSSVSSSSNPQNLEELLERQWEQGSQFLMEQAQHYDIASLLSCLHSLRQENMRLEDHVASLNRRRDHLLAVNARLSVPLTLQSSPMAYTSNSGAFVDRPTPGPGSSAGHATSPQERNNRGTPYMPQMENGMAMSEHLSAYMNAQFSTPQGSHRSPVGTSHPNDRVNQSPVIVSSRNPIYHPAHSGGANNVVGGSAHLPPTMSPVQGSTTYMMERNLSVLRSPSSTPEMARSTTTLSQQQYAYQIGSPTISGASHMVNPPHPMAPSFSSAVMANQHALNARRDLADLSRHSRPIERR